MKKMFILVLIVLLCLVSTISCKSNKIEQESKNNEYNSATNLIKKKFNQEDYIEGLLPHDYLYSRNHMWGIDDIKYWIGVECLRDNNGFSYSVHKFINKEKKEGYCFISYDNEALYDCWFVSKIPDKSKFLKLRTYANSFDDVKQLDSTAFVYENMAFVNSIHRFKDGSMVRIIYVKKGDKYIISSMEWMEDPSHIVENLLPIDLELIE